MRHPELPKLMFSAAEVAEMIGMSHGWVLEQARYRRVPHVRFGRRVMFRPAAVDVLTEQFAVEPAAEPEHAIPRHPLARASHTGPLHRPRGVER